MAQCSPRAIWESLDKDQVVLHVADVCAGGKAKTRAKTQAKTQALGIIGQPP